MDWERIRLPVMGIVTLALVGVTYVAVTNNSGETNSAEGAETPSLPEVDTDALTELTIQRPAAEGEEAEPAVTLVKDGESWRVSAPVEAPAAQAAVSAVLEQLGGLEVIALATSRAEQHERMEVDEAHGIHVVAKAGDETVIDLWIGRFRSGATSVRQAGQDSVVTVAGSIRFAFDKPLRDFRDRTIVEETASEVTHAHFVNESGDWSFEKRGGAWAQVLAAADGAEEGPAEIETFDPAKVRTMVTSIARLRAMDFAPADADAAALGFGEGAARVVLGVTPEAGAADDDAEGDDSAEGEAEDDDGEEGEAAEAPLAAPARSITLLIGAEQEEGKRYVMREGDDTIYVVSRILADRLLPDLEAFQESDEPEPPPAAPPGMPGGLGGAPGGGQIPPEIMRQLQQQLQQQGR